ncbi:hypothetical protein HNQ56_004537 [Anaerotaenia torta]|uniref:leucine-rich repeat protein n=1 Tax=Anaerotaenia torta TaxID=433293 RepID=UPI003D250C8A
MKKIMGRLKGIVAILLVLSLINIPMQVARAGDDIDVIGNEYGESFDKDGLTYRPLLDFGDPTDMAVVNGSYSIDKKGKIDRESCDEEVSVPATITYEGKTYKVVAIDWAFEGKKMLKKVILSDNIIKIRWNAFAYSGIVEIYISKNVSVIYDNAFAYCEFLEKITVDIFNPYFKTSEEGKILYTKDGKELIIALVSSNSFVVEEGVEIIRASAFSCNYFSINSISNGYYISKLTLPQTIKRLSSIPKTLDIIEFKSKNPPIIDCVVLSNPVVVPKGSEKAYSKISYNLQDILPSIVSSVKTLKYNEDFINKISQKDFNNSLKRTVSKDVKKVAQSIMKMYKTDKERYIAIHRYIVENLTEDPSMYLYGYGDSKYSTASKVLKYKIFTIEGVEDLRAQLLIACNIKNLVIPYSKDGRTDKQYLLNIAIIDGKRVLSDVTFENACLSSFKDKKQNLDLSYINVYKGCFVTPEFITLMNYKLGK